jgi:AcrR family transcriptional regulator
VAARRGEATRTRLLDAASRLFSERGVGNVSLAEIVRAAEQRNASALHYHFGGRQALVEAVLGRYVPVIRRRRLELLDAARHSPSGDLHSPVAALVRPVTELAQQGPAARQYLHIGAEVATGPGRDHPGIQALFHQTAGYDVGDLLAERLDHLPEAVFAERFRTVSVLTGRAASDRVRMLAAPGPDDPGALDEEAFTLNLIDMIVGALAAPVSPGAARPVAGRLERQPPAPAPRAGR